MNYEFKDVKLEIPCNECENDIFSLLQNKNNSNQLFQEFLLAHENINLLNNFFDQYNLNINNIPENIKKNLFN